MPVQREKNQDHLYLYGLILIQVKEGKRYTTSLMHTYPRSHTQTVSTPCPLRVRSVPI
ncbi:hypothetical protein JN06_00350 [Bacteroides zoogleoformans]|nr:hypothetical protein JN06_00350 [Bacteroides zoogleoformans]